ncbi:MAG: 6-hydroxymethylpterin diphosphokinase MptE-like protein [Desulfobulbus sp.]|jgi:hypothetical protein
MTIAPIIERLRASAPEQRPDILNDVYRKNIAFFKKQHPELLRVINNEQCPYRIDITETFLNIIDERTGELAHTEAGLDTFSTVLGDWTHDAWVELFNVHVPILQDYPMHAGIVQNFLQQMYGSFPEILAHMGSGRINLKELDEQRRFSPPVVFLGIFHGLHIAQYMARTEMATALFIEPEPDRFEVSCYFLDYEEIEQTLGQTYYSISPETTTGAIESFFSLLRTTSLVWSRVLCGYPFEKAHIFIESLKGLQTTGTNLLYPLDNDILGLRHGALSIQRNQPLLTTRPQLSRKSRIAVVATGPSLNNDIAWLQEHQHRLIIFAVHSAVKVLRNHGIKPDFQFNLDTVITYDFVNVLELFPDVPFVADYRTPPHILDQFTTLLLCGDTHKQSVVRLKTSLTNTHPSTTNLAFSLACFLKPGAVYLLGCDCGYRDLQHDHAVGSMYNDGESDPSGYADKALQNLIEPNFPETEPLQTIAQHLHTKLVFEKCIASSGGQTAIYNLSDGAAIRGAAPRRSHTVRLSSYPKKHQDVRKILGAFSPARKGKNWTPYAKGGKEKLRELQQSLIDSVQVDPFDWKSFSLALDKELVTAYSTNWNQENDHRMDAYVRVIGDLLHIWYASVLFLDKKEDAEQVYMKGLQFFREAIESLTWPDECDAVDTPEKNDETSRSGPKRAVHA